MELSALLQVSEFRLKLYPLNFDATRNFYAETLHFPITEEWDNGPGHQGVMFAVGNTTLELLSPKTPEPIQGTSIALEVPNVEALWEALKDTSSIAHALRYNSWGDTSFSILDPEGFAVTFFTKTGEA
jgi:uncharacterized glyoxalase superfamily protein PhnB